MVELKEGTFLDLEDIQEYENSGDHTRVQGKYQGKPRRGIFEGYDLCGSWGGISWKENINLKVLKGVNLFGEFSEGLF